MSHHDPTDEWPEQPAKKTGGHEFLLPNDLGWKCNDEISALIDAWVEKLAPLEKSTATWQVAKAELMDDIYAVIKKHQQAKK